MQNFTIQIHHSIMYVIRDSNIWLIISNLPITHYKFKLHVIWSPTFYPNDPKKKKKSDPNSNQSNSNKNNIHYSQGQKNRIISWPERTEEKRKKKQITSTKIDRKRSKLFRRKHKSLKPENQRIDQENQQRGSSLNHPKSFELELELQLDSMFIFILYLLPRLKQLS